MKLYSDGDWLLDEPNFLDDNQRDIGECATVAELYRRLEEAQALVRKITAKLAPRVCNFCGEPAVGQVSYPPGYTHPVCAEHGEEQSEPELGRPFVRWQVPS